MSGTRKHRSQSSNLALKMWSRQNGSRKTCSYTKLVVLNNRFKSHWETYTARLLLKNGISFAYEPRSFELRYPFRYTPDFVLNLWRKSRRIIIEPHGIMNREDFYKLSLFREAYGSDYFLVLLVRNDNIPFVPEEAYDDIWPIEYVELLFDRLSHASMEHENIQACMNGCRLV